MPKLGNAGSSRKLFLPSTDTLPEGDKAYIVLSSSPEVGTVIDAHAQAGNDDPALLALYLVTKGILEWNFTDDNDAVVPITVENVRRMDLKDYTFISSEYNKPSGMTEEEEKKSDHVPDVNGTGGETIVAAAA